MVITLSKIQIQGYSWLPWCPWYQYLHQIHQYKKVAAKKVAQPGLLFNPLFINRKKDSYDEIVVVGMVVQVFAVSISQHNKFKNHTLCWEPGSLSGETKIFSKFGVDAKIQLSKIGCSCKTSALVPSIRKPSSIGIICLCLATRCRRNDRRSSPIANTPTQLIAFNTMTRFVQAEPAKPRRQKQTPYSNCQSEYSCDHGNRGTAHAIAGRS